MGGAGSNPGGLHVVVDDRERRSAVVGVLRAQPGIAVTERRLDRGDYQVDGQFLFERKTLSDLVCSIESGRLFSQALRLVDVPGVQPALILEGTAAQLRRCRMRPEAVRGALITITLFIGLPVLRTRCAAETVDTLRYTAEQGRKVVQGALPRRGRRPRGKSAYQNYLLQGLPGVGPERARRLLERFGSVRAVMAASPEELANVCGIGWETARRIDWAVRDPSTVYRIDVVGVQSGPPAGSGWDEDCRVSHRGRIGYRYRIGPG